MCPTASQLEVSGVGDLLPCPVLLLIMELLLSYDEGILGFKSTIVRKPYYLLYTHMKVI